MKEGIYQVSFLSSQYICGQGILVVKNGTVNGGDSGFIYSGHLVNRQGKWLVELKVKQWNQRVDSIFGAIEQFQLTLEAKLLGNGNFTATGCIFNWPQARLTIEGQYLAQAA